MTNFCPICDGQQIDALELSDDSEIIREMKCRDGHRWREEYVRDWNSEGTVFRPRRAEPTDLAVEHRRRVSHSPTHDFVSAP
jgi:hypothetical protein